MPTDVSRRPRRRLRALLGVAIVLLGIAVAEIDVYRVRGASMAPWLDGAGADADLLVAVAHLANARAPRRFDLVVHDRPRSMEGVAGATEVDGDRCVKRIVAFAGEKPVIRDGDLFLESVVDGVSRIERAWRGPEIIKTMTAVVDRFSGAIEPDSRFLLSGDFRIERDRVRAGAAISGDGVATRLEYDGLIADTIFGANGEFDPSGTTVHDTGIEVELLSVSADAEVVIELREQGDLYRVRIGPAIGLRVEVRRGPSPFRTIHEDSESGSRVESSSRVRALNCDDRILVWIDDRLACDVADPPNDEVLGVARNDPALEVVSGTVEFGSVSILRDVHYLSESPLGRRSDRFEPVPAGAFFVLGDNSRNSIDSRDYGPVDRSILRGVPILRRRAGIGWSRL